MTDTTLPFSTYDALAVRSLGRVKPHLFRINPCAWVACRFDSAVLHAEIGFSHRDAGFQLAMSTGDDVVPWLGLGA